MQSARIDENGKKTIFFDIRVAKILEKRRKMDYIIKID